MPCKYCLTKPVIQLTNSQIKLCRNCFIKYFEKKALKTIKTYNLIEKNDKIAVAVSGGKDSLTVLNLINLIRNKFRNIELEAVLIDEGIKNYRDKTILDAKKFCKANKIKLNIFSYKKEFGYTLDEMIKKFNLKPCTVCGVLRRYLLNKYARNLGFNKLATGHNLDDEVQSILMNQFKDNIEVSARLGPLTGIKKDKNFIPRIKPLYLLTEKETAVYAYLKGFTSSFAECPNSSESYRGYVRDMINDFEAKSPGTKHGIIHSFLKILPLLKEHYKNISSEIKLCSECGEPCTADICQACKLIDKIKKS